MGLGYMVIKEIQEKFLSPLEVRNILKADNQEIVRLCKQASIAPKKNNLGQTMFAYNDVKILKSIKCSKSNSHTALTQSESQNVVESLIAKLADIESNITGSLSKVIDDKLDGMDEVVVELIRCKTENESLRQKINELNKENYHLKNSITDLINQ